MQDIRNDLNVLGVNAFSIFPELEGLCSFLQWKYFIDWALFFYKLEIKDFSISFKIRLDEPAKYYYIYPLSNNYTSVYLSPA